MKYLPLQELLQVQWYTGMPLLAQHFQSLQKFNQANLQYILNCTGMDMYGVLEVSYQINNHLLSVSGLHAIMPDLTHVMIDISNPDDCLSIELDTKTLEVGKNYFVFLTVPVQKNAYNAHLVENVQDDFNVDILDSVSKLKPNLSLTLAQSPPAQYNCLPLLEFKMVKGELTQTDYHYPFLKWNTRFAIWLELDKLKARIRSKLDYLNAESERSLDDLSSVRSCLIKGLLNFEEEIYAQRHPYFMFKAVLNLVANLAVLDASPLPIFRYNHQDIQKTFQQCINYSNMILDTIHEQYNAYQFVRDEVVCGQLWKVELNKLQLYSENSKQYYLCSAHMTENYEVLDDWINSSIISTQSVYDSLLSSRVLGAKRLIVEYAAPIRTKSSKDTLFFKIEYDPNFLKDEQYLIIANNADNKNAPQEVCGYSSNSDNRQKEQG